MIANCRICGNVLRTVYDLGDFYLSDFLKRGRRISKRYTCISGM